MSKSTELRRVELRTTAPPQYARMNIYVDADKYVKVGDKITLADSDDPDTLWEVMAVHEVVRRTDIKHGWNNNI